MVDFSKLLSEAQLNKIEVERTRLEALPSVVGVRTDCFTGVEHEVYLKYEILHETNEYLGNCTWFMLLGGPTGSESFQVTDDTIALVKENGWLACNGTPRRWDTLYIPAAEMARALDGMKAAM